MHKHTIMFAGNTILSIFISGILFCKGDIIGSIGWIDAGIAWGFIWLDNCE